jgi:DNA-binding NarL/FixJ family response regulator
MDSIPLISRDFFSKLWSLMARRKTIPTLRQRQVLAALAATTATIVEAERDRERMILEAREAGATGAQIAEASGLSESTVWDLIRSKKAASGS